MRPVSDAFLRAVTDSHEVKIEVLAVGQTHQTGTQPTGAVVSVVGGSVHMDGSRYVRSTIDLEVPADQWPTSPLADLAPYGQEVFVRRGVNLGRKSTEWVSLGYFRIDAVDQDDVPHGAVRITGSDRMIGIVEARFEKPFQAQAGTYTYGQLAELLVQDVYPDAEIEWDDTDARDETVLRQIVEDRDRAKLLFELATAQGKLVHWDHRGKLVFVTPDTTTGTPVFTISHGRKGVLVSMSRGIDRRGAYNGVRATGQGADTTEVGEAPTALAFDSDPLSPTRWGGPFGKVPRFFFSPLMTTTDQVQQAAETMLFRVSGVPYDVSFGMIPNPALEPYDVVWIRYPGGREKHVIETLDIPLMAENEMSGTTKQKRLFKAYSELPTATEEGETLD